MTSASSNLRLNSLSRRLLLVAATVVLVFLGLTGVVLDQAFRQSLDRAQEDRLLGVVHTILAAADLGPDGRMSLSSSLPDARLSTPASGLYALILDNDGTQWRSPSLLTVDWHPELRLVAGDSRTYRSTTGQLQAFAYGLSWEDAAGKQVELTIHAAEDPETYNEQLRTFRTSLWSWLGAAALALLLAQIVVLRWSLLPLAAAARDLHALESGHAEYLSGQYPTEISGLVRGLNRLLRSERERTSRYRNTLANLAHSLKTPLTILRASLEGEQLTRADALEQVDRIDASIQHQLRYAVSRDAILLRTPLPVKPVLERILQTLAKAHFDKPVEVQAHCHDDAVFAGTEGDLMELLGNLIDNAYKWARQRIHIHIEAQHRTDTAHPGLQLSIEDDGPGIGTEQTNNLLARGARADEHVPGHGIGLAIVADLVADYHGQLNIDRGSLGGAWIRVELPGW